jgi:hypothetical protein
MAIQTKGFIIALVAVAAAITMSCVTIPGRQVPPPGSAEYADVWTACKLKGALKIELTDNYYHMPKPEEWRVYFPMTASRRYVEERWDCDDYALDAWVKARHMNAILNTNKTGIAVGFIAFNQHAANVVLLSTGEIFIYDVALRKVLPWPKQVDFIWF